MKSITCSQQLRLLLGMYSLLLVALEGQAQPIFTEIMADPSPTVGLPEAEYVELYNPTEEPIPLHNWQLADDRKAGVIPDVTLEPKAWLLLCATKHESLWATWGLSVGIPSFPSLNNSGETLYLINQDGDTVQYISYQKSWYKDSDKDDGGWSLENTGWNNPCLEGSQAWGVSSSPLGGTPAQENSTAPAPPPFNLAIESIASHQATISTNRKADWSSAHCWIRGHGQAVLATLAEGKEGANSVILTFPELPKGYEYELAIEDLNICGEEAHTYKLPLILGDKPQFLDLLITEIMADPSPSVGLPEVEYIELYNNTNRWLSLTCVTLMDGAQSCELPDTLMPPHTYWATGNTQSVKELGMGLTVAGFPSLNNSGEYLGLWLGEHPVFEITYSNTWHHTAWGEEGGFSLEMTRLAQPCLQQGNWKSTLSDKGGTPQAPNSQSLPSQDHRPPRLLVAQALDHSKVRLLFDETLHPNSLQKWSISFSEAVTIEDTILTGKQLDLLLSSELLPQTPYFIEVSGVEDCHQHTAMKQSYTLFLPEQADSGDVVINEVLPKPFTGGTRFIEVINRSAKHINLQGWQMGRGGSTGEIDKTSTLTEEFLLLPPEGIAAFTADTALLQAHYPQAIGQPVYLAPSSLPSWGYEEDNNLVALLSPKFKNMDSFFLQEEMIFSLINEDRGVSIERVDRHSPSDWVRNWRSASSTARHATPGSKNSQHLYNGDGNQQWEVSPKAFSPNQDGYNDLLSLHYQLLQPNTMGNIYIFDLHGRLWKQLANNHLLGTEGFYQWDGIGEAGLQAPAGVYIAYIETFQASGSVQKTKLPFALATVR